MRRVRGYAIPDADLDHAWPTAQLPMDPWAGDEALKMRGSYQDYLVHCERISQTPTLDEAAHESWDDRFEQIYRKILDGHAAAGDIEESAKMLRVWGPTRHDLRPLPSSQQFIPDTRLADITENQLPQVGMIAPGRILGPWSDTELPRWVRVVAAAAMAFPPEIPPGVPAWARAIKRRPKPPSSERTAIRSISRCPPMLWRITGPQSVVPHLPLGARQIPNGVVRDLPDAPAVIGRVVWTGQDWRLACGLPLPQLPPKAPLVGRLELELLRLRRRERRMTWEVMLRERSEVLYRTCCEWLWLQYKEGDQMPWV
jgi:hypothetical protein